MTVPESRGSTCRDEMTPVRAGEYHSRRMIAVSDSIGGRTDPAGTKGKHMKSTQTRAGLRLASAVLLAGVAVGGLSACGGPPAGLFQQQSQQSGQIPSGALVTGGSVNQNQGSSNSGSTGGAVTFGK